MHLWTGLHRSAYHHVMKRLLLILKLVRLTYRGRLPMKQFIQYILVAAIFLANPASSQTNSIAEAQKMLTELGYISNLYYATNAAARASVRSQPPLSNQRN